MLESQPLPSDSVATSTPSIPESDRQQAFLLHVLATADGQRITQGQVTRKLKTKAGEAAGLKSSHLDEMFELLEHQGFVRRLKTGRTVTYELTEAGATRLATLRDLLPAQSARGGIKSPANDQVRGYRIDYLLLQVLRGINNTVTEGEANKALDSYGRAGLELNTATANQLRRDLAAHGWLTVQGTGRGARYSLTEAGILKLGNMHFEKGRMIRLQGATLNSLLEAAREVGKQLLGSLPHAPTPAPAPTADELGRAILVATNDLLRECHAVDGLVPVHEVRTVIRQQFGDTVARHDQFDEAVLRLWRAKKLGLVPITDPSKATADQLRDSIPGEGDTLFYLELAYEPAIV